MQSQGELFADMLALTSLTLGIRSNNVQPSWILNVKTQEESACRGTLRLPEKQSCEGGRIRTDNAGETAQGWDKSRHSSRANGRQRSSWLVRQEEVCGLQYNAVPPTAEHALILSRAISQKARQWLREDYDPLPPEILHRGLQRDEEYCPSNVTGW